MGFVNTIVIHITDGNKDEERMVRIMGEAVIEKGCFIIISDK